jgi:hypothetical protein
MKLQDVIKEFLLQEKRKKRKKKKTGYPYFVGPFYMSYNLGGGFEGGDIGGDSGGGDGGGGMMEEAVFPENFDVEEFKELRSFKDRLQYCNSRLKKLGAGTGRIAYQIDDGTVLKLAKNAKGVAQNEAEDDSYVQNSYSDIVPKIHDNDNEHLWIISDLAKRISKQRFKALTGIEFELFGKYIVDRGKEYRGGKSVIDFPQEIHDMMYENEFVHEVMDMLQSTSIVSGDFERISSFGEIDGRIVIVDLGLTSDVYDTHYTSKPKEMKYNMMQEIISKDYYKPELIKKYLNKIPWAKTDGEPVGQGKMGTAFMTDEGDLLKLTYDSNEAEMAKKLLNKNLKYFPNIYRVAQFKRSKIYVILKEFVEVNDDINDVVASFETHIGMAVKKSKMGEFIRYHDLAEVFDYLYFNINRLSQEIIDDVKEKLEKENPKLGKLFLDLLGMIREAKKHDIVLVDFIHHNVGMKNGNYCLFDNGGHGNDKVDVEDLEDEFINEAIGVDDYDEDTARKLLSKVPGINARFIVGHGSKGTAFLTQDRKVIKLTKDSDEAITGRDLIGKNLKHFPTTYYVGQFKKSKIFVVVKEYIRRSKQMENLFERLEVNLGKAAYDVYVNHTYSDKEENPDDKGTSFRSFDVIKRIYNEVYHEDYINEIAEELAKFDLKEFFFDVCELIDEARENDISIYELLSVNIGEKNGKICLFDYGRHRNETVDVEDLEKELAENSVRKS